jgi:hypothetical protein
MVQLPAVMRFAGPLQTSASTTITPKNTNGETMQAAIKNFLNFPFMDILLIDIVKRC